MKHHLIYCICPMGCWKWNLELLKQYWDVFDGRKMASICYGAGLEHCDATMLEDMGFAFDTVIRYENDPNLGEVIGFKRLLKKISEEKEGACFFGHTKGVSHGNDPAIELWTKLLYQKNLEEMPLIDELLKSYNVLGAFRRFGKFRHFPDGCRWHYSGTFFWFTLRGIANRPQVQEHRYGAEAWPGLNYDLNESACLWADDCRSLYNHGYMKRLIKTDGRAEK